MTERILLVDDEPRVLDGYRRQLRRRFDLDVAEGPQPGLTAVNTGEPYAVVVSDLQMPGMDGIEFLTRVRDLAPDTVRVMLTGQADLDASMAAVNTGQVFRFLTKPCPADVLAGSLDQAIEQYRLVTAERDILERTLRQTAQVLVDVLEMTDPEGQAQARHVQAHVARSARQLGFVGDWRFELAAMLAPLGSIGLPAALLSKLRTGKPLTSSEAEMAGRHPQAAYNLLVNIPRLREVARIILAHERPPDGRPLDLATPGEEDRIAIGAHLINIGLTYERALAGGATSQQALDGVRRRTGPAARSRLVDAFAATVEDAPQLIRAELRVGDLRPDMVVAADIRASNGAVLLAAGQEVTEATIERLRTFSSGVGIVEPMSMFVAAG